QQLTSALLVPGRLTRVLSVVSCAAVPRDLHSFPTRRSSDLSGDSAPAPAPAPPWRAPGQLRRGAHRCETAPGPSGPGYPPDRYRSEEHTSELQSRENLVCRLLLEKKNRKLKSRKLSSRIARH